jgi:Protein of unknown function (DUF3040)
MLDPTGQYDGGGDVPLSEHEQRLLEQMERALYAEDPKLASTLRGADLRAHHRRRIVLGVLGFIVGVTLLVTGAATSIAPVGVLGFVTMLASAWWVTTAWRGRSTPAAPAPGSPSPPSGRVHRPRVRSSGVMDRLEERWRRRREGDNPN